MAIAPYDREWTTKTVRPHERFSYWREAVHQSVAPLDLEQADGDVFSGRLAACSVSRLQVVQGQCDAHIVNRTKGAIARSDANFVYLICPVRGPVAVRQASRSATLTAGDCAFVVSDVPFCLEFPRSTDSMTLRIPFADIAGRAPAIFDFAAVNLARQTLAGRALASLVHMVPQNRLRAEPAGADAIARLMLDAIEVAAREIQIREPLLQSRKISAREIIRYIDANLADPLLSPGRAARAFAVSERSIHLAMRELDETFMSRVRVRRLDKVAADIADGVGGRTISEVAFKWGFCDLSVFHRAFRDRFASSPRVYARSRRRLTIS